MTKSLKIVRKRSCMRVEMNTAAISAVENSGFHFQISIKTSTIVGIHFLIRTHFNENALKKYFS